MKRTLSALLAMLLCLSLLPGSILAAPAAIDPPLSPMAAMDDDVPDAYIDFTDEVIISFTTPQALRDMLEANTIANIGLQMDWSINSDADWKCTGTDDWSSAGEYGSEIVNILPGEEVEWVSAFRANYSAPADGGYESICYGVNNDGEGFLNLKDNTIYMKLRFRCGSAADGETLYSDWTPVFTVGKTVDDEIEYVTSAWAKPYAVKAGEYGLIPDCLAGADLKQPITRAEFAALSVKLYEVMSGKTADPIAENPFTDTADAEILKAYDTGIINGVSDTEFAPARLVTREQAAAMLTRAYKAAYWEGWTLTGDKTYTAHAISTAAPHGDTVYLDIAATAADPAGALCYTGGEKFADDASISAYARESVYFMAVNGIINGVGDHCFAPNTSNIPADAAVNYGQATREAALKIAVVSYENLGQ